MREYLTVRSEAKGEYTEKRSRFVSGIYPCHSEEEAILILSKVRSENFGANHNVYAYVLNNGTVRFSDDSEPHGTAGKPVLEVIEGKKLEDVIIVVTRYFGGVLLGTGGLVRSYTSAAQDAVKNSEICKMCECAVYKVCCGYSDHAKLVSVIKNSGGEISDSVFEDKVSIDFTILEKDSNKFETDLCEAFSSRISANKEKIELLPMKI